MRARTHETVKQSAMSTRRNSPHPRSASSARLSADEFRALMGRDAPRSVSPAARHARASDSGLRLVQSPRDGYTQLPYEAVLPFVPPSVNALFLSVVDRETGRPKRVLTNKAREARRAIGQFVRGRLDPNGVYELHIIIELPAVTKSGHAKKLDLTNRVKFLEDCIAASLGIDDRLFFRVVLDKLHADHERTVIRILPYKEASKAA